MLNTAPRYNLNRPLIFGIGLVFVFWLSRIAAINTFPPFIDEAFHINFGANILQNGLFMHAEEGRQFTIWWYMLFQASQSAPFFTARVATLLLTLLGFAAALGIGRRIYGEWGLVLAGLFYLFSTYHLFFGRLALADPVSASWVLVAAYVAYRLSKRIDRRDAVLTGSALFLAVGTKVSALPYLSLPILAAISLHSPKANQRKQLQWLIVALVSAVVPIILFFGLLIWRNHNPFFYLSGSASILSSGQPAVGTLVARFLHNVEITLTLVADYFGLPVLILFLVSTILLMVQRQFFLILALVIPALILWTSERQASRHLMLPLTFLLLNGAVALAGLIRCRTLALKSVVIGAVLLWGTLHWLPFAWTAARQPANLPLPPQDFVEYVNSEGSGSGLPEITDYFRQRQPKKIIGMLANCISLRLMAQNDLPIICPTVNPNGESREVLEELMQANRAEGNYVILETVAYVPATAPGKLIAVIERPRGGTSLRIYDLAP